MPAAQPGALGHYVTRLLEAGQDRAGIAKFESAHFEAFGSAGIAALARGLAEACEVGATYAEEAERLRTWMPRSIIWPPVSVSNAAMVARSRPHSPVIVSASRGIAATTARTMCLKDYRALHVSRIEGFAAQLTGAGRPEPGEGASLPLAPDLLSAVAR
jgi:hypothetical protein